MSPESGILVSIEGHVAQVTLNRPAKRNAVDMQMFEALASCGVELMRNDDVRAVVVHGAGGHFSAGIDTSLFSAADPGQLAPRLAPQPDSPANDFQRAAWVWREVPVPVVCAIEGTAFGAGLQIALGADIRISAADARFSVMEICWGLIPDIALSVTTRGLIRPDRLRELVFTGRIFDAREALEIGAVTQIADDPHAAALTLANEMAGLSPTAVRSAKQLLNAALELPEAGALALEARLQARLLGGSDQAEAVRARVEGRRPVFGS